MNKKYISGFIQILFILVILIALLVWGRLFVIPSFFLPKTTQQSLKGENCDNLPELFLRNMCFKTSASNNKDATLCERIIISTEDETSSQNKNLCYKDIARITHNSTLCEKAGQFQSECLSESK